MTLFKNDDTLEIIYKLFQAYSYFFHQNKTEITSTVTSDANKVPSCKAVSTALAGKLDTTVRVDAINDDNKNDTNGLPTVNAVAAYIAELGLSSLGEIPTCNQTTNSITVTITSKIGAVKVTSIGDFDKSKVVYSNSPSAKTLTVSGLSPNTSYFVEVYNDQGQPFRAQRIATLVENGL